MNVPLLDLKAQYAPIRDEVRKVMDEVCDAQYFILGPKVEQFEKNVAEYCGVKHAVGASSGTDALLMAMMALDIGAGDAVITSTYTFFATAGSIARLGATPIFVDIDPVSFNIDPEQVRAVLANPPENVKGMNIKAIVPVHLYGQMADMDSLLEIASEFGVSVIEDAAQAIGAEYPSKDGVRRAGAMGDMGCFSFFPSKNLGGFGDGGMVVTNDDALADKLRKLRNHGMAPKYYHQFVGGNFRLDALQAVVLDVKLKYLDEWHAARRDNAAVYNKAFAGSSVETPATIYADTAAVNYHIYNQYIIRVEDRDAVRDRLLANDIGCDIYYPVPMHLQECFSDLGYKLGDFPISEQAANETLALPIYPELTDDMQEYVAGVVKAER
ncbi:MAG: DegT/DnrJ/EryC1/StrS family aminotransferase [Kiritimatiellae bacterium]|nr:DegT/DnrJ/EryC1/StrS family aminotransferase [Kiritimatiellia bacterium]